LPGFVGLLSMAFFVNFFPKLILAAFQVLDDFRYTFQFAAKKITKSDKTIPRATFLNYIGAGFAGVAFSGLLYGVVQGKYDYRVENIKVKLNNLPDAFKGLRIVQISDAHLGSFVGQPKQVLAALQAINDLKPDLILFTGDLVNSSSSEAESWIDAFANLEAPLGKFSIMGNHDYAEYGEFAPGESEKDVQRLHEIHSEMGFHLMLDEHIKIERDGSQIVLAGVENWSKRSFGQKGDLDKALYGSNSENLTTILMTHDPTHFEECVMDGKAPVDLTLSGHTHGMQVGIKIDFLGINYSPAKLLYKRWGGLYTEGRQLLYVNRGFGVLAFRGRIGMPPEITVLELA
jgi:predicted MPP superfamily phosphohydrolase